jgi:FkbM family methyltransferase
VGSNYGFISLALQSNLTSQTSIFSFEPHPEIVKAFSRSILKNDIKNIILENVAVGNDNELIEINLFGQTSNILIPEIK